MSWAIAVLILFFAGPLFTIFIDYLSKSGFQPQFDIFLKNLYGIPIKYKHTCVRKNKMNNNGTRQATLKIHGNKLTEFASLVARFTQEAQATTKSAGTGKTQRLDEVSLTSQDVKGAYSAKAADDFGHNFRFNTPNLHGITLHFTQTSETAVKAAIIKTLAEEAASTVAVEHFLEGLISKTGQRPSALEIIR